jgi:hypothetical protein
VGRDDQRRRRELLATGDERQEPLGAASSPSWERSDAAGQSSWEDQLSRRNQGIFDYEKFRELPPAARPSW